MIGGAAPAGATPDPSRGDQPATPDPERDRHQLVDRPLKSEAKRQANRDRQKKWRDAKRQRKEGFTASAAKATPPAPARVPVHRTDPDAGRDFGRFNPGGVASSSSATPPPAGANPFAGAAPPKPAAPPVTEAEAAPYGEAVAFYCTVGMICGLQRNKDLTDEERAEALNNYQPLMAVFIRGAVVRLCVQHNIRLPYIDEGLTAVGVGLASWAMFGGKGAPGLAGAMRVAKSLIVTQRPPPTPPAAPTPEGVIDATSTERNDAAAPRAAEGFETL